MEDKEDFVRFDKVQKSYDGETLVVQNLNLGIEKGEFLTLLGPSGSGKTTCLMMVAGFETATEGEIYLEGAPINRVPPNKRGIGMVFQNYALFPHMTVKENLAYPLRVRKIRGADLGERVEQALEMVQLSGFGHRLPGQLSGGQQQRVALARALVFQPRLVLMDEPLGALDKQLREQMQYEIKHIHETLGVTVLYVTHDQSEALTMSNRIAVFNDGVIQQLANPTTLYEAPENAFVAQFIGENNRLLGQVEKASGEHVKVRLEDGASVFAKRVNIEGRPGEKTQLSLRPERVLVAPGKEAESHTNARVLERIFLGDHIRVRCALGGSEDFIVKLPNGAGHKDLGEGENVALGWRVEDCRALEFAEAV